ncbi:hypothetical protein K503DRAFT_790238 [Rhizopogon vinicolor AM-OR11-026]|uniref:G domain-containing protein n=1 Tax=Rhizopogon vinicolor AM-OR11-026 TaxID=1314800 RepID=A0A1B7NBU2_9AGAM|nr:hypothetical protein K503DRAFT_790238 [Rhizopogon vinicolor AM-OR11-026]
MSQIGNIILVGETGVGKSSIINMIAGTKLAETPDKETARTFGHHPYTLPDSMRENLKVVELYKLITGLNGGINLLMFCMSAAAGAQKINNAVHQNWKIFSEILCKKQVPSVLVVTGLEQEENMDEWWWNNRRLFEDQGIRPDGTACITTIRGKTLRDGCRAYDEHYEKSQAKIPNLILNRVLLRPWRVDKINWFYEWTKIREAKEIKKIVKACGMSREETARFKEELAKI